MAARRLIIVLVVLFAISIAAAAIAPDRRTTIGESDETESTTTTSTLEPGSPGSVVEASIVASSGDPETIEASVGDQLALEVVTERPLQVAIEPLGLVEDATPDAPARFDILLRQAGALAVSDAQRPGEVVGRIDVSGDGKGGRPGADR